MIRKTVSQVQEVMDGLTPKMYDLVVDIVANYVDRNRKTVDRKGQLQAVAGVLDLQPEDLTSWYRGGRW